ncbi:MAG: transcriptional repressor [Candidatus Lokiarchaeota archaeon]|nr:transcriptional repressor [Candidatus Lokiarchaeota archaeon]
MDINDEKLIKLFHSRGFKVTPQRLGICNYVLKSTDHPSAEKIYSNIKKKYKTISRATVYKTIALLKEMGLISELNLNTTPSRYDPNQNIHVNIICPKCNSISDYESEVVEEFFLNLKSELDNDILGQNLDVYKICETCSKKK